MKKLSIFIGAVLFTANVFAQAPQKMSYQAIVRNSSNMIITGTTVGMQLSILQGSASGTAVYVERQTPTTNVNGLATVEFGSGTVLLGSFASINWGAGPYFIKTETDPSGGVSYSITGTSQLMSVPYALFAATSGSGSSSISGTINKVIKFTGTNTGGDSQLFDDGINVGVGEIAPSYKLHVTHGGATGILCQSTSSFSCIDIDGASGDAALRFKNAGVNQWNVRNRPTDNYFEIFELGGGGSRMVIQDATGNVGIGAYNPLAQLEVWSAGATGTNMGYPTSVLGNASTGFGVVGLDGAPLSAASPVGVYGNGIGTQGVYGTSDNTVGVLGYSNSSIGVEGYTMSGTTGVEGLNYSTSGQGVYAYGHYGLYSMGTTAGALAYASASSTTDVFSQNSYMSGYYQTAGLFGTNNSSTSNATVGFGMGGSSFNSSNYWNVGVYAEAANATSGFNYALYARGGNTFPNMALCVDGGAKIYGDLTVTGAITGASKSFKIDHPADPANKYLVYTSTESPDMLNIYSGNITTDNNGLATVTLPDYFEMINTDERYQLTAIGSFASAMIKEKVNQNHFIIQTNQPNVEISWQVTGVRNDKWAQAHRTEVEQVKTGMEAGKYMHPELFGKSANEGITSAPPSSNASGENAFTKTNAIHSSRKLTFNEQPNKVAPAKVPAAKAIVSPANTGSSVSDEK